jgi:hypothetical protein
MFRRSLVLMTLVVLLAGLPARAQEELVRVAVRPDSAVMEAKIWARP